LTRLDLTKSAFLSVPLFFCLFSYLRFFPDLLFVATSLKTSSILSPGSLSLLHVCLLANSSFCLFPSD
jgi:hypothetical protein